MDKLFELSAELTLDAAAFLQGLARAEAAARSAASTLQQLQSTAASSWSSVAAAIQNATDKMQTFLSLQGSATSSTPGFATGIDYVPYNDFPARLHEGEAVLTSLEAAQWRSGQATASAIDAAAIGQAVASALSGAIVQMDSQTVGQLITPTVSREMTRQSSTAKYHA
ncbi:MAG: hypothetical protein E7316_10550 [Clostridiales bacterium]|nr:hypothetical protein [Clostridiales bacterium]